MNNRLWFFLLGAFLSLSFGANAVIQGLDLSSANPSIIGPLVVGNGGTGATTLTGIVVGNGAGALTAANVTGAVKDNGSGVLSQATCADLSGAATSCSTDATNASNISSGVLAVARGGTGSGTLGGNNGCVLFNSSNTLGCNTNLVTDGTNLNFIGHGQLTGLSTFGLSGNISGSGILGTNGIVYKNVSPTITDTTASGTIITNYDSVFGGSTLTTSSSTTITTEFGAYFKAPVAGANMAFSSNFALGSDSLFVGGQASINQNISTVPANAAYALAPGVRLWGADNSGVGHNVMTFGINGATTFLRYDGSVAGGTSALLANEEIGRIGFGGATGAATTTPNRVRLSGFSAENWSGSANGAYLSINTTPKLTAIPTEVMRVQPSGGLSIGSANVSNDQGNGILVANGAQLGAPLATSSGGTGSIANINTTGGVVTAVQGCISWNGSLSDQSGATGGPLVFTAVNVQYCQYGNIIFAYGTFTYPSTTDTHNAAISLPVAVPNQTYAKIRGPFVATLANAALQTVPGTTTAAFVNGTGTAITNVTISTAVINFMIQYPAN